MRKPLAAITLVAALVLSACGAADSPTPDASPTQSSTPAATVTASEPAPAPVTSTVVVTVAPPAPDATFDSLLSAQIPSLCEMPAQQLVNGTAPAVTVPSGYLISGELWPYASQGNTPLYVFADVAGLGRLQAIGAYRCGIPNSGSYIDYLLAVDYDGTTLGHLGLRDVTGLDMTGVSALDVQAGVVVMHWMGNSYPGQPVTEGTSILSWRDGQLVADPL